MLRLPRPGLLSRCCRGVMGCIVAIGGAACASGSQQPTPPADGQEIRAALMQELARRAPSRPAPDSATTIFTDINSAAVDGVRYHWAEYYPASTVHVRFVAVLGVRDQTRVFIRVPEDWLTLKGPYLPASAGQALQACGEWVRTTAPVRIPRIPTRIYEGPASLTDLELPVPDPSYLRDTLTAPETQHLTPDGWRAVFWAIEARVVRKYECRLLANGGSLVVRDSLPGQGYPW